MDESVSFSDPRKLSDDGLEEYLKGVGFDKNEEFEWEELRKILKNGIERYFKGEVTIDFVIGLGCAIYDWAQTLGDIELLSATCGISELVYQKVNGKKVNRTKKEIEEFFRWSLSEITK